MTASFSSNSQQFTKEQRGIFNQLKKGDKVMFESIKAKIKGSTTVTNIQLPPTIFTVN